jgi:hypothetical protein
MSRPFTVSGKAVKLVQYGDACGPVCEPEKETRGEGAGRTQLTPGERTLHRGAGGSPRKTKHPGREKLAALCWWGLRAGRPDEREHEEGRKDAVTDA